MRIHHLNTGTMCPIGQRLVNGTGSLFHRARMVCHCLLVQTDDGLALVDTGIGLGDIADPPRLVLDFLRPVETVPLPDRRDAVTPLRVLVLDAGHGGHDSGAVGPGGLQEKDLVLDVTRRVARLVEDKLNVKVLLSRDGDYFVPLRDRTSFANKERADLFVSIHANAHREVASAGVETYFLSSEATDSGARRSQQRQLRAHGIGR